MPSGVAQASCSGVWPVAAVNASAQAAASSADRRAERQVGEARDRGHAGLPASTRMGALERRQHVRAGMDELVDARRLPGRAHAPRRAGPSGGPGAQWACLRARAAGFGQGGVVGVAGADRRLARAAGREGVADILERRPAARSDAARTRPPRTGWRRRLARAANSSSRPRVHRNTRGRSPVRARMASLRSRSCSKPSPGGAPGSGAIGPDRPGAAPLGAGQVPARPGRRTPRRR